ncbi:DUF1716-domain-containing protein [Gloeophyllum trabeum ATCC 11539]|uniref:DUF1716-domain-containing protein n=1 Tax=Gloeophyllum trabeum (strain ATCC 11539 / FP-39264 / Madison 617) TaxID=670483 RepID=S7S107_GLOTA|nr:DUF1716-domain-containing protein [Gloeophyllum trabeum ATCC 11539]EPQ59414.1 DUF1716-domain-containing protein [Gloeophyllum trabeum ATCC 11539]
MDIDKMFKMPKLPGGGKRKMPEAPTPEMLKRIRLDSEAASDGIANGGGQDKGKRRAVTIEDEEEESETAQDFAPGGDADYFVEEDEEGRFFGGGLTSEQKEILNIFDKGVGEGAQEDVEELNATGIRKLLLRFERAANKNQDQRSKYPDDPSKFIDSEADLDSAIKALLPLAQVPALAYPELVKSGMLTKLIGLLTHENPDIALDVVELLNELTDEDVGDIVEGDEEAQQEKDAALKTLIEALLEQSIFELLVDNLGRLNEAEESDRQGIFHILGVFENILGFNPELSTTLVDKTSIMTWLLNRVKSKTHDENRGYAAEILSILLQNNRKNRLTFGDKDGVEILLNILSQYRRRDPVDGDEAEFMENIFDTLCSALGEPEIKDLFLKSEGVDLMVLLMKEKMESRSRAIKVLDYAMSGTAGTSTCETFVDALGLKSLFAALMGKGSKKSKNVTTPASEDIGHILSIISSLFSNLPSESPARVRLLAKFVENNYEKVDKLLEIRENAQLRLVIVDSEIDQEKKLLEDGEEIGQEEEDAWYLRRLDGGLFTMQTTDYILAWIAMEDDGVRSHLTKMLDRKNKSLKDIVRTLGIYHDNVDEEEVPPEEANDPNRAPSQKEILKALIAFLDSC